MGFDYNDFVCGPWLKDSTVTSLHFHMYGQVYKMLLFHHFSQSYYISYTPFPLIFMFYNKIVCFSQYLQSRNYTLLLTKVFSQSSVDYFSCTFSVQNFIQSVHYI